MTIDDGPHRGRTLTILHGAKVMLANEPGQGFTTYIRVQPIAGLREVWVPDYFTAEQAAGIVAGAP